MSKNPTFKPKPQKTELSRVETIEAIDSHAAASGLKPSSICQYSIANRKFYERLHSGYFHEERARRVVEWIKQNPADVQGAAQ